MGSFMGANEIITYRGYALTVVPGSLECTVNVSMFNKPGLASCKAPSRDEAIQSAKEWVDTQIRLSAA